MKINGTIHCKTLSLLALLLSIALNGYAQSDVSIFAKIAEQNQKIEMAPIKGIKQIDVLSLYPNRRLRKNEVPIRIDSLDYLLNKSTRYAEDGKIIAKTDNVLLEYPHQYVYLYNSNRQLKEEVAYYSSNAKREIITTYRDDGLPDYVTRNDYLNTLDTPSVHTNHFDYRVQNGNYIIESKTYSGKDKLLTTTEIKEYDHQLRLLNHTTNYNGQTRILNWKYETTTSGSTTIETEKDWDGEVFATTEVYNTEGKLLSKIKTTRKNRVISSTTYQYIDDIAVATTQEYYGKRYKEKGDWKQETMTKDGALDYGEYRRYSSKVLSRYRNEYEYDTHGNWVICKSFTSRYQKKEWEPEELPIITIRTIEYYP